MRRSIRRSIFYFLIIVFIIATPLLILYAVGYSIDFSHKIVKATGGIFVKTNVTGISVALNGVLEKNTNFFTKGALLNGLEGGAASIEVTKVGYLPWRKSIDVKEQVIQEFRSIILVPENLPEKIILASTTAKAPEIVPRSIMPSPDGKNLLYVTDDGETITLRILDTDSGVDTRPPIQFPQGAEYVSASWSEDQNAVLVERTLRNIKVWDIIPAISQKPVTIFDGDTILHVFNKDKTVETITRSNIRDIAWSPKTSGSLYIQAGQNVYAWERKSNQIQKVLSNVYSFAVFPDTIAFVTSKGFIAKAGLDGTNIQTLDRPGIYTDEKAIIFTKDPKTNNFTLIDNAGGLYIENNETQKFFQAAGNITRAKFASQAEKLAYSTETTLADILTADEKQQPFRRVYARAQILDAATPITDFMWFGENSTHLIFTTRKGVFLTETDTRFGVNTISLRTGRYLVSEVPGNTNSFYLTDGNSIEEVALQ